MPRDVNPFGTVYRIVCKKIGTRGQPKRDCSVLLREIISTIFPPGLPYNFISRALEATYTIPEVTGNEIGRHRCQLEPLIGHSRRLSDSDRICSPGYSTNTFSMVFFYVDERSRNWFSFRNLVNRQGNHHRIGLSAYLTRWKNFWRI